MTTASASAPPPSAFTLPRRGAWIGGATALVAVGAMATALSLKHPVASPLPAASELPPPVLAQAAAPRVNPPAAHQEAAPACNHCGTVTAVRAVRQKGKASGAGAAIGGVLGGVVGNQMGKGKGRTAMTVIGAVGGGAAGHEIEKRRNATTVYQVTVHLDDGSTRTLTRAESWAVGRRVSVNGASMSALPRAAEGGGSRASARSSSV